MGDYSELIPLSTKKPFVQFIVSMLVILVVSVAGLMITLLTAWLFFGIAPGEANISELNLGARDINYFKYLQTLQHLSIFLLPSLVIAFLMKGNVYSYIGLEKKPGLSVSILSILLIIFLIPLNSFLSWLNEGLDLPACLEGLERWMENKELQAERITQVLMEAGTASALLVNVLIIAVIPAVGEEFLYRGVLQNIFKGWFKSGHLAVILTAFLFSATHLQFYGFIPRFILGLGFGYIYLWSMNIWLPVMAHLVNNLIPVILSYFYGWEYINSTMDEFSSKDGLITIIPTIIAVLIMVNIKKISFKNN
ncbi:MAG: CPBP family intramembrane glutamic endopeptidase [Bacteroidota bacterium]|nr:CPBP family intramembrane glutamic endopeptidase [Bacteroidota bacterium]